LDKYHHIYFIQEAIKTVQPSLTREGFTAIPNVKWEDVGALDHVREVFDHYILNRIKHPGDYEVMFNTTPFKCNFC
jgi:SpoVK/Ycf46/Vps4 family AAA+-type ATPase